MKNFVTVVIMLCALMVSSTALAEEWTYITQDVDGNKYFINYSSVHSTKNDKDDFRFSALVKIVYSEYGRADDTRYDLPSNWANFASYKIDHRSFRLKKSKKYTRSDGGAIYANDGTLLTRTRGFYFFELDSRSVWFPIFDAAYNRVR